jgi:solute carrier family 25 (mitochondrial S-adenosylmethionine transporter), member 26
MFDLAEQHLPTLLPLRNSRFSRPRRRIQMTTDRRMCMHASLLNGPSTSGVLGSISAVFPMSDVLAGAAARAASQSTIHPLDTIKVRMQASLKGNTARTLSAAAVSGTAVSGGKYGIGIGQASATAARTPRSVAFATGAVLGKLGAEVGSLYKGVLGAASGAGIAIGAYFAFYGAAKRALESNSEYSVSTIAFLAGGIGALGSSIVKVPAAVCIRSVQANVYPNVVVAARQITSAAGPRGLFTGYLPTLLEDVPDMAVKQEESAAAADISMGLIAGAVAAGATTPLDVVKTRMMCNASQRPSFAGAIIGVWQDSRPGFNRLQTFFTGVGPRAFSNGINSAIFFCFFEIIRSSLKQGEERRKSLLTSAK